MSTKQNISTFFGTRSFVIPAYQRDYAWQADNINDLFSDIEEAMEFDDGHYIGTFILSEIKGMKSLYVVDGQQRLTTLTMLLDAFSDALDDAELKSAYKMGYIHSPIHGKKFSVMGSNEVFFSKLLNDEFPTPESDGQQRLLDAYKWIHGRVKAIKEEFGQEGIKQWLEGIGNLQVLEFTEANEGKAIRMFQSVNDRGVPLTKMDIAKSLLIYYSNRFLDGALDETIANQFGEAFRSFSQLKKLASEDGYRIDNISRAPFKEDDIFRYHYFAFNAGKHGLNASADYSATTETVLSSFLKPSLIMLRTDKDKLKEFISDYVNDLVVFFKGIHQIVKDTRSSKALYLLFSVQDISATLYPLIIRLSASGKLSDQIPAYGNKTLLQLIEIVDLRVFKLRGTNPQADMVSLVRRSATMSSNSIADELMAFCQRFMPDAMFESCLSEQPIYGNPGLRRIFMAAEDNARNENKPLEIAELAKLFGSVVTAEHILPKEPSFALDYYGFESMEQYLANINRLGNLAPLEKSINSACQNITIENKMNGDKYYRSSDFMTIHNLATSQGHKNPAFSLDVINTRGAQLAKFCVDAWPISKSVVTG